MKDPTNKAASIIATAGTFTNIWPIRIAFQIFMRYSSDYSAAKLASSAVISSST